MRRVSLIAHTLQSGSLRGAFGIGLRTIARTLTPRGSCGRKRRRTGSTVSFGTIAVTKVEKMTGAQAKKINKYNDGPEARVYWLVTVSYEASAETRGSGWDWKVKDYSGRQYDEAFFVQPPDLHATTLRTAQEDAVLMTLNCTR